MENEIVDVDFEEVPKKQLSVKLMQICFTKEQLDEVEVGFVPFDNTQNEKPELREYHNFKKIIKDEHDLGCDLWGAFGPRWREKMKYDGLEIREAIKNNPGHDVYIFNHARVVNALTYNVWEQGEMWHKGITKVTKYALEKCRYDPRVVDLPMTDLTCYCSYFVATREFWKKYIRFLDEIKYVLDNELDEEHEKLYKSSANYARDSSLNLFVFIVERLFSTFLYLHDYKVYTHEYDYSLYRDKVEDFSYVLNALYQLKRKGMQDEEVMNNWNVIRTFFLTTQPQLLSLD